MYEIAFLEGDTAALSREAEWARGNVEAEMNVAIDEAQWTVARGQMRKGREQFVRARALAEKMQLTESAAHMWLNEALAEAWYGNPQRCAEAIEAALALSNSLQVQQRSARMLAELGKEDEARALMSEVVKRAPTDTFVQTMGPPLVAATIELHHGRADRAIELMEKAKPYDRARPVPRRLRVVAYLQAGRAQDAVRETKEVLELRHVDPTGPIFSVLRVDLARAYALAGDTAASRQAYQDFLALWSEADPDVPLLKQAREEYARLQ
jgi:predicted Zn-dependent protease